MHLTLHLTDRCNLACRYCYARRGATDMTLETALAAIERCAEGPNCGIIFFGGEPLLRAPLIWAIMEECEARQPGRFHYKVTTNGTLLDDAFLDEADRRSLHIALSHDGLQATHDAFRADAAGAGSFDAAQAALVRLMNHRPYSPIMMTVNPETVHTFAESVQFLQSQRVQYLITSLNYFYFVKTSFPGHADRSEHLTEGQDTS